MGTVLDLISRSMRLIGALSTGEVPTAAEATDALDTLNDMLEAWNSERLMIYSITRTEYTLQAGHTPHTIGPGGDWNTTRPQKIEGLGLVLTGVTPTVETPIQILTDDEWQNKRVKDLSSGIPRQCWYNDGWPLGQLYFWPTPTVANNVAVYTWQQLGGFTALTDSVTFPPGYAEALRYNLGVKLAPEFGLAIDPVVFETARESKARLKNFNHPVETMRVDSAITSRKDVAPGIAQFYSGE